MQQCRAPRLLSLHSGASPIFKGQELAVVGGGDTATEEAVYLTKYGKHVHLLVRGPEMRASKTMQVSLGCNPPPLGGEIGAAAEF